MQINVSYITANEIMEILGKEESLRRIRKGIELLNDAQ